MFETATPVPEKRTLRDSVLFKMIVIGLLGLALLVPLGMVRLLISERQARRDEVSREVAAVWGQAQTLAGPLLTLPYRDRFRDEKGKLQEVTRFASFLPETLEVKGKIDPEKRSRGLFEVVVYSADIDLAGTFKRPDFSEWRIDPQDVYWDDAVLTFGIPDMRGIRRGAALDWAGRSVPLSPGGGQAGFWETGLRAAIPGLAAGKAGDSYRFRFDLAVNGSRQIRFLPAGRQTTVSLQSAWSDPSFAGAFLPDERRVTPAGFSATWNISYFGRGYPQQWRDGERDQLAPPATVIGSAFGVDLFLPVDGYQKSERSVKYGVLFLILTFLTFFLYETFQPFSLHPMQYFLVGSALCLFYLLLLSLSEHLPFGGAYAVASAATVGMIGTYSVAILRGAGRALLMTGILGLLYGYLYVLLQAEDYALLLGSVGLFVILALVMYVTRRIDWYAPRGAVGGRVAG